MAYVNPGYAAAQALQAYVLDKQTRDRQDMLDSLKIKQEELKMQEHQQQVQQQQEDRRRKMVEDKVSTLVPGDVPSSDLMQEYQGVTGMKLPTKIQADGSDEQGPMPGGADPLGTERIYLGSPQYRMGQLKTQETQQQLAAKAAALSAIDSKNPATFDAAMQAGATPAEIKSVIESRNYTDPNAPVPIVRIGRDGKLVTLGEAPKNAHFQNEPAPITINNGGQGGMDGLSDSALSFMAERVLAGGDEPAFGSGTQGAIARQKFATKLAEVAAARGITGEQLTRIRMRYKAEGGAANALERTFQTTEAFSDTARQNLNLLRDTMKKIPDSNVSVVNTLTRGLARATGNADVAAFDTYRRSVANEFARIISQANGGVLTDSARKEVDELVRPNASVAQIEASLTALDKEAHNRTTSYGARLEGIYGGGGNTPATPAPGAETPEQRRQRLLGYITPPKQN